MVYRVVADEGTNLQLIVEHVNENAIKIERQPIFH